MNHKLFAIFGNPVSHSKSPLIHNGAFRYLGIKDCYARYELQDGKDFRHKFFELSLSGANITIPFKEDAFSACDTLDMFAREIGAVNTVIEKDGKLMGYNTDAPGFMAALDGFVPQKALILGAGGTARAIAFALRSENSDVVVANRSKERLSFFKERGFSTVVFDDLEIDGYDLIVNTTSAGLKDDLLPTKEALLEGLMKKAAFAFDCIYRDTPFLKMADRFGVNRKDGIDMLLWQAFYAFEIFNDKKFDKKLFEVMKASA